MGQRLGDGKLWTTVFTVNILIDTEVLAKIIKAGVVNSPDYRLNINQ